MRTFGGCPPRTRASKIESSITKRAEILLTLIHVNLCRLPCSRIVRRSLFGLSLTTVEPFRRMFSFKTCRFSFAETSVPVLPESFAPGPLLDFRPVAPLSVARDHLRNEIHETIRASPDRR